jgi:hypothetical protein
MADKADARALRDALAGVGYPFPDRAVEALREAHALYLDAPKQRLSQS